MLGGEAGDVLSIKVRPISADGWNAYVYANEYNEIWSALGPAVIRGTLGESWRRPDNAGVYKEDDNDFVVAEHETGPEIVAYWVAIAAGIGLADKIVGLIKTIIETINKHAEIKKSADADKSAVAIQTPGERYYGADGISLEIRTKRGAKRIASFELAPGTHISEAELLNLLKASLQSLP